MNEKIIVPLDGSFVGESALPYVKDLLSKLSPQVYIEVILLHVVSPANTPMMYGAEGAVPDLEQSEAQTEKSKTAALEYLDKTAGLLKTEGVTVTTKVVVGDASAEIVKAAEEIDANLIAMSTHGRSGISRWAFGSVTDKVLRREGRIPIAMIKAPKKSKSE